MKADEPLVSGLVGVLEQSAINIVDSVEKKASEALSSVDERIERMEKKATEAVNSIEQQAVSFVNKMDQVPQWIDSSVRSSPYTAACIGLGIGAAIGIAQELVTKDMLSSAARNSGKWIAQTAATWALNSFSQARGQQHG